MFGKEITILWQTMLATELNAIDCRTFVFAPQCRGVSKKSLDSESNLYSLNNEEKINELKSQLKDNPLIRALLKNWFKDYNMKEDEEKEPII
ncbi:unnamed protein product [Medioppia subpectinata]|uniref:Uncharacterized protein n=1 Tax=Medioppia subpectinata TaxID=1979941 RepID=A0A7R9Q3F3_9ACAR|nr:unnamed protein product [Medioppia subpectinata]CAG2111370.1 unnamed protein product [Medioppia subpectinata]